MIKLSDQAETILSKRYYKKGENWEKLVNRVINFVLAQEPKEIKKKLHQLILNRVFLPNSPTLMHAGTNSSSVLSGCFVLPIEDSKESIFKTLADAAILQSAGGGTGYDFSKLRPKGSLISTGARSSGPVSFMKVYNYTIGDIITQGAGARQGAQMGILRIDHPDILEFIGVKRNSTELTNFNLSVAVTNEFIYNVTQNKIHIFRTPLDENYPESKKYGGKFIDKENKTLGIELVDLDKPYNVNELITAEEIFNYICETAHASGDPGLLFIDRINEEFPLNHKLKIWGTNPCGEQPLVPYGKCCLGSISLVNFLKVNGKTINWYSDNDIAKLVEYKAEFDFEEFEKVVQLATRFLDDVVSVDTKTIQEILDVAFRDRPIGLGVMGLADTLLALRLKYGSAESFDFVSKLTKLMTEAAWKTSAVLAIEKGKFPNCDSQFIKNIFELYDIPKLFKYTAFDKDFDIDIQKTGFRNSNVTVIAPTGTLARLAEVSWGIEPHFYLTEFQSEILENTKFTHNEHKLIKKFKELDKPIPVYFVTAHEILPSEHLMMQNTIQKYITSSISKTINLSNSATLDDVKEIYLLAFNTFVKGITIFRDGCKDTQVIYQKKIEPLTEKTETSKISNRPLILNGKTIKLKSNYGNLYLTVNFLDKKPIETFIILGKAGSVQAGIIEAIARLISVSFKYGITLPEIINQLDGIKSDTGGFLEEGSKYKSLPDLIAKGLTKIYSEILNKKIEIPKETEFMMICPQCQGTSFIRTEGCIQCKTCGWAKCD